jgi:hypothetical protein
MTGGSLGRLESSLFICLSALSALSIQLQRWDEHNAGFCVRLDVTAYNSALLLLWYECSQVAGSSCWVTAWVAALQLGL